MGLSSHDRKVLAAIEHDLSGQDPKLADLFATASPGGLWRPCLPVPLRAVGWLVGVLLALIVVHTAAGELNPLGSAASTVALVVTWLVATARATRGRRRGPATSRPRPESDGSTAGSRAATSDDNRDDPDDGCCPA
jgi:hypothetical protein